MFLEIKQTKTNLKIANAPSPMRIGIKLFSDRATAIRHAIREAKSGDGVLNFGNGKIHFDDREQSREALILRLN